MKSIIEDKKKLAKWIIGIVVSCILIYLGVRYWSSVTSAISWCIDIVMPLLVGSAIAMILNVPMSFLETHLWTKSKNKFLCTLRRLVAFVLSLILILGIFAGIVMIVLPTLVETVTIIVEAAIEIVNHINSLSREEIEELPFGEFLMDIDWSQLVDSLTSWLKDLVDKTVNGAFGTITSLVGGIIDMFVAAAFAIYLLFSKEKLKEQGNRIIKAWLPKKSGDWVAHAIDVANLNFKNFIVVQFIEAVILGVLCYIGMRIFDFPYPAMISTLVGVTALVPVIGSFVGGGVGAFILLAVDPIKAIWFVVYIVVLQQIEGNLIYPRVVGDRVKLPAMWILAAVTIGGAVGGPVGILIAVPLTSTVYVLFFEATEKREKKLLERADAEATVCEDNEAKPVEVEPIDTTVAPSDKPEEAKKTEAESKPKKIKKKKK